jgi:hypothetical protein
MLTCQQCRTEIDAAARPERLTARAAEHLSACAACRTFQAERQQLRRLIGELEPVGAPPDFEFRLSARMAARPHATTFFNLSLLTPRAVSLVMAASLVLAFAVTLRWRAQQQPATGGESVTQQSVATIATPTDTPKKEGTPQTSSTSAPKANDTKDGARNSVPAMAQRHLPKVEHAGLAANTHTTTIAPVEARDSSLLGTPVLTANNAGSSDVVPTVIPVSVPASGKPLQVLFKDTQGATRVISIEPVSFGSRELLGRRVQVTQAKLTTDQGVW